MIGAIIQARLGSTRLCHKVLREVGDDIVLGYIIKAALQARLIQKVIVTTPDRAVSRLALTYAQNPYGVPVVAQLWKGSRDPLAEYCAAASLGGLDLIVRLTADCPLLMGEIIDATIQKHLDKQPEFRYSYNQTDGQDVEVFDLPALEMAFREAGEGEREHVTTWIRHNLPCQYLDPVPGEYLSLNTAEDYDRIKRLIGTRDSEERLPMSHGCTS